MAAHQSIVTSLRVKIKGRPTRHGGRHGIIPAGTIGYIHGYEPYTSWDMTAKVYNFYPNNFTETTGYYVTKTGSTETTETTEPLTDRHRIIVLADDVVYHVSEASDPKLEPVVDIAICEAGYARMIGLSGMGGNFPSLLRRCVIEIEIDSTGSSSPCKFVLRELDGTDVVTMNRKVPVWAGRLLSAQKSQTAFIFARDSTSTYDIEFFRVRPILHDKAEPPGSASDRVGTGGFLDATVEGAAGSVPPRKRRKPDTTAYAPPESDSDEF